jgi:transcriptional regulator with XRE-family HTH domain
LHPADERLNQPGGLAERLYRMRKAARLTGDQLAAALGWGEKTGRTKVSKIENGRQAPSRQDIQAWAAATGHPDETEALLDLLADVQTVHTRWRQRLRGGQAALQEDMDRRTQAATRIRNAEVATIPGLLQTPGYARAVIEQASGLYGGKDIDAAVEARMRRQDVLYNRGKTFEFAITEPALRMLPCPPQVMLGQLDRLDRLVSMGLDNVTIGIIPMGVELPRLPWSSFLMLDDEVMVETYGGKVETHDEDQAVRHEGIFGELMAEAVTGDEALRLITAAAASLRNG